VQEITVEAAPLAALEDLLTEERRDQFIATALRGRALLADRMVWNVNATAHGGGVAEMLDGLLAFGRGAGVDTRWLVLDGDPEFFAITKRIHNALHGTLDSGADLAAAEHAHYDRVLQDNLASMTSLVRPGDIVLLHDPQTAGLCSGVAAIGAHVIWRCHIGRDESNDATDTGWQFLRHYLDDAHAFVFSRVTYVPDWVPSERARIIAPSIDPSSLKNRELTPSEVGRVLRRVGLIEGGGDDDALAFTRRDGSAGVVRRHSNLIPGSAPCRRPMPPSSSR